MHKPLLLPALLLASCAATPPAVRAQADERPPGPAIEVHLGGRGYDDDDWDDGEADFADQFALGLVGNIPITSHLEGVVGFWGSAAEEDVDGSDVTSRNSELSLGLRGIFGTGTLRPYIGAGISFVEGELESREGNTTTTTDDGSIGAYLSAGLVIHVHEAVYLGFDVRAMGGADYDIQGEELDAGYGQATLFVGVRF